MPGEGTRGNDGEGKLDILSDRAVDPPFLIYSGHRHTFLPSSSQTEIMELENDAESHHAPLASHVCVANNRFLSNRTVEES